MCAFEKVHESSATSYNYQNMLSNCYRLQFAHHNFKVIEVP